MTVFYLTNYKPSLYCPIFEPCKNKLARNTKDCVWGWGDKVCLPGAAENLRSGVASENRAAT